MVFIIAKQRETYASSQKIENKYSLHILADLMANAERRAQEGKYDDAVARLYRAVEVIAQMILAQKGIDTSAVSLDQLPPEWQVTYQQDKEPLKLGQEKAFALLESLGHPAGKQYRENKNLRNYLSKRNSSILAHEMEPVGKNVYEELNKETLNLAINAFPGLDSFKEKCRFPRLELK